MTTVRHNTVHWLEKAACKGPNQAVFYGPISFERKSDRRRRETLAKAICATCPVEQRCRDEAINRGESHGIWGGLTERERRALAAR